MCNWSVVPGIFGNQQPQYIEPIKQMLHQCLIYQSNATVSRFYFKVAFQTTAHNSNLIMLFMACWKNKAQNLLEVVDVVHLKECLTYEVFW